MANREDEINNCYKQLVHNTHASSSDRARLVEQVRCLNVYIHAPRVGADDSHR